MAIAEKTRRRVIQGEIDKLRMEVAQRESELAGWYTTLAKLQEMEAGEAFALEMESLTERW